jgi:hypothetical protein
LKHKVRKQKPSLLHAVVLGLAPALDAVRNAVEHPLRQLIRFQRGAPHFPNESKEDLFAHLPANEQKQANDTAERLHSDFHLQHLCENSSADNYRLNLFYLEMLERALSEASPEIPQTIQAADIGPADWFYAHALYSVLKWWRNPTGRTVRLTGYEADAYRVYSNLFSRYDCAHGYMNGLEDVQYLPRKFTRQPGKFQLVAMLFPFVFLKDHLTWGLPVRRFNPVQLLRDAWASLKPGGVLVVVNQGEAEHVAQRDMLLAEDIRPAAAFQHPSQLHQYDLIRYVLVAIHDT